MPILNWLTRDEDVKGTQKVPYRLLEEVPELSYGDKDAGNMLIQGDNLEALKALLPFYAGQVKCIYIDPPYNTGAAFERYDDNLEHSKWLAMMYPRLELLKNFLKEDGFICCQIDDSEGAYLRVLMDEVFGRNNYQVTLYVQVRYANKTLKQDMKFHKQVEQVLVYRASYLSKPYLVEAEALDNPYEKFNFQINELSEGITKNIGGRNVVVFQPNEYEIQEVEGYVDGLKEIWASGSILDGNSSGRFFRDYIAGRVGNDGLGVLYKVPDIGDDVYDFRYFSGPKRAGATKGKYYQGVPLNKRENVENALLPIPNSYDFAGSFGNCRLEGEADFRSGKKPEAWLQYLFERFSTAGDTVLDSFMGSGSSAATAHKMGRQYIGVEMGPHAVTHCQSRLQKVVDGEQSGVSQSVTWQGGGGFRFYRLGANAFDEDGRICSDIRFPVLAAHVWFSETSRPWNGKAESPVIGINDSKAYALLYNGILGDKRPQGGNVLTGRILEIIREEIQEIEKEFSGQVIIYGESSRMGDARLKSENIVFKQTPYDVKAR